MRRGPLGVPASRAALAATRAGVLWGLLALARTAQAAGLFYVDPGPQSLSRGGAIAAAVDDATATFINPARLLARPGTDIVGAVTLAHLRQSFDRIGVTPKGEPYTTVHHDDPPDPLPTIAGRATFGLENWAFGLAIHAPNAISQRSYPVEGPQRYALVATDIKLLFVSAAVAWAPIPELSIGIALEMVSLPTTSISIVVDGYWLKTANAHRSPYDGLARITVDDPARFTATVGLHWRATDWFEVGLSARVVPVHIDAHGILELDFLGETISALNEAGQLGLTKNGARLQLTLPPVVRLGLRLVGRDSPDDEPWGDIELDVVYEAWSMYEEIGVSFDGALNLASAASDLPLHRLDLPRHYDDTISVRLGGSLRPGLDWLKLSLGGFYESAAAPPETTTVDAAASHRFGIAAGLSFRGGPMELTLAYAHVFELPVDVPENGSAVRQQRPLDPCGPPYDDPVACNPVGLPTGPQVGAGRYTSSASLFTLAVRAAF